MTKVTTDLLLRLKVDSEIIVAMSTTREITNASSMCSHVSRVFGEVEGWRISVIRDSKLKTLTIKKIKR